MQKKTTRAAAGALLAAAFALAATPTRADPTPAPAPLAGDERFLCTGHLSVQRSVGDPRKHRCDYSLRPVEAEDDFVAIVKLFVECEGQAHRAHGGADKWDPDVPGSYIRCTKVPRSCN